MHTEDKTFPEKGKWDFSNDEMRLQAHEVRSEEYFAGYRDGQDDSSPNWALPLAIALVSAALIAAVTYLLANGVDIANLWRLK